MRLQFTHFRFFTCSSLSNPGFPEPETRFFSTTNPDIFKNLELLLHSNISDYDNTEGVEWRV